MGWPLRRNAGRVHPRLDGSVPEVVTAVLARARCGRRGCGQPREPTLTTRKRDGNGHACISQRSNAKLHLRQPSTLLARLFWPFSRKMIRAAIVTVRCYPMPLCTPGYSRLTLFVQGGSWRAAISMPLVVLAVRVLMASQ
jgi:hypothetical protein